MKYRMIIFDADDTLYDFTEAEKFAFEKTMKDMNFENKEIYLPIYLKINNFMWKQLEEGKTTQSELKIERFRQFMDKVGLAGDPHQFARFFTANLIKASFLFAGVEELIETLHKTHRLVMITNGLMEVQKPRIREHQIAKHFEKVIISEEIGYAKPDPRIFRAGLKDLEPIAKDRILIVGDNLSSDIRGGINYGIDTCWFNPNHRKNNTEYKPTFEIDNLEALYSIVL